MLAPVLLATLIAQVPATASTPAPVTAPNPAVAARASDWFRRLQRGNVDYSQLDGQASKPLNSDVVLIISTDWSALGNPLSFVQVHVDAPSVTSPDWVYVYRIAFRNDVAFDFYFGLDPQGKISGMRLGPEQY